MADADKVTLPVPDVLERGDELNAFVGDPRVVAKDDAVCELLAVALCAVAVTEALWKLEKEAFALPLKLLLGDPEALVVIEECADIDIARDSEVENVCDGVALMDPQAVDVELPLGLDDLSAVREPQYPEDFVAAFELDGQALTLNVTDVDKVTDIEGVALKGERVEDAEGLTEFVDEQLVGAP
jgi:hypothetical protein